MLLRERLSAVAVAVVALPWRERRERGEREWGFAKVLAHTAHAAFSLSLSLSLSPQHKMSLCFSLSRIVCLHQLPHHHHHHRQHRRPTMSSITATLTRPPPPSPTFVCTVQSVHFEDEFHQLYQGNYVLFNIKSYFTRLCEVDCKHKERFGEGGRSSKARLRSWKKKKREGDI